MNGEGIFTGKGIYEVETLSRVLEHRFPRNALLSHDLIEGAYARAGLVSDVEVIDDYPSHYSAFNRRKHRWLRGDWQIAGWLSGKVPDESGRRVPNPISFLSRWKIVDNLRRSLVEAGIFLLFVMGWTVLPGRPVYWTLVAIAILFVPPWFQFAFATGARSLIAGQAGSDSRCFGSAGYVHDQRPSDADVSGPPDPVVRRCGVAHLLSPAGFAGAIAGMGDGGRSGDGNKEADVCRCPVELDARGRRWLLASSSMHRDRHAIYAALADSFALGLQQTSCVMAEPSSPTRAERPDSYKMSASCGGRRCTYWRYFATFATREQNWLIPDNVQEKELEVAARTSPTNIGLLLNTRQVACEFGYITVPEFVQQNRRSLDTVDAPAAPAWALV